MLKELINSLKPKIGGYITVVKWLSHSDRSYVGDVLRIEAIDEPFIVVKNRSKPYSWNITLNLGDVEIRPLNQEFVDAALRKGDTIMVAFRNDLGYNGYNELDFTAGGAIDKRSLADDLTEAFMDYQYRLDNPIPSATETKEAIILKYRTDPVFHAQVNSLVNGVMCIISKHT